MEKPFVFYENNNYFTIDTICMCVFFLINKKDNETINKQIFFFLDIEKKVKVHDMLQFNIEL